MNFALLPPAIVSQEWIDALKVALPLAAGILVAFYVFVFWVRHFLHLCPPNEVLIFSGGRYRGPDGAIRRYKTVFGGRGWRKPFVEKVASMSLNTIEVPIAIRGAYSRGGIPLNVDAIANVKISSDEILIGNAIERFLGRDLTEVRRVAKETLEGHLRGVLATLTPEEVNEDRLKFADSLSRESEEDLSKLGLHVDTLKIQHVTDDVQYLNSIGREAIANVIRSAEIAESDARRAAELLEAESGGRASVAEASAQTNIVQMQNELRRIQADLEAQVRSEEERTVGAAREARAKAEQELQRVRSELEALRLQVEQVLPAEADREAKQFRARGEAALIRERGAAVAESLALMNEAWREAGADALQITLIGDIERLLRTASEGVAKVRVEGMHMIDAGDGKTLPGYMAAYPAMLEVIFDSVATTTGIDVPKALRGKETKS